MSVSLLGNALGTIVNPINGFVGIGTANPLWQLTIDTSTSPAALNSPAIMILGDTNNLTRFEIRTSQAPVFQGRNHGGTVAAPLVTPSGRIGFALGGGGYDGVAYTSSRATIIMNSIETYSTTANGMDMTFATTAIGAAVSSQRFKIDETSLRPTTDNFLALGGISNRWTTVFAATGTINTSDARNKMDVTACPLGLDFILALPPKKYRWDIGSSVEIEVPNPDYDPEAVAFSASESPTKMEAYPRPGVRSHLGFLAQDVKGLLDAAGVDCGLWVLTDKDDPDSEQALRYDQFIPVLVKAVQELAAKVEALEATRPA